MNDDALRAVWIATPPSDKESLMTTMNAVIEEDRIAQEKDRWVRVAATIAMVLLCPALLWFSAHGRTPLVRGGYALMAMGTAVILFGEWAHRSWSRQTLPGPADARSQLQKTALFLSHQANLFRTALLWCGPIFLGAALVGIWIYQERSVLGACLLWTGVVAGWLLTSVKGFSKGKELDARRSRIEAVLSDFG